MNYIWTKVIILVQFTHSRAWKTASVTSFWLSSPISYSDLVLCFRVLNEKLALLLKHPVKLCIFTWEAKGPRKGGRIYDKTACTQKRITRVQKRTIHAQRKEERCDVRGSFYNAEIKFKGQMVWPNAMKEKVFWWIDGTKFQEGKMQEQEDKRL